MQTTCALSRERALDALLSYLRLNGGRFADDSLFSAFYRLTFLLSREKGVNTLECSRASVAWRALLHDRFTLLNEWCAFVSDKRNFITEDTWRQVLDFCIMTNRTGLRGYDPMAAWPVLIDEFVEYISPANDACVGGGDGLLNSPPSAAGFFGVDVNGMGFSIGHTPHRYFGEEMGHCSSIMDTNKRKCEAVNDDGDMEDLAMRLASNSLDLKRPRTTEA